MNTAQKYIFDTDFEEEAKQILLEIKQEAEAEANAKIEEPDPTFTEAELHTARTEGFNAGKEEGIREAAGATEQRILETLKALSQQTEQIFHGMEDLNTTAIQNAMSVGASIVRKLFPHLNERHAETEVEALIDTVIKQVISDPKIQVHVNAGLFDAVKNRLSPTAEQIGHGKKVEIIADSTLPEGNCRIEWESGGAARDAAGVWRDVDEILERNLGGTWKSLKEVADSIAEEKAVISEPITEQASDAKSEPSRTEELVAAPENAVEEVAAEEAAVEEVIAESTPEVTQEVIPEEDASGPETPETDVPKSDDTPEGQGN
jgi:flagellar biosynthesis/type III secretory pathway protein FliH